MGQRCDALLVGNADIGPIIDQQLHNLLVRFAAFAEDNRLHQCSPPQVIDVIDVDIAVGQQCLDDFDMAAFRGRNQGSTAVSIGECRIRAGVDGKLQDLRQALCAGIE